MYSAWNTISKIDVYEGRGGRGGAPGGRRIVIDAGTAATTIPELRPSVRAYLNQNPDRNYPSGIAYIGKSRPRLLIIGPAAASRFWTDCTTARLPLRRSKSIRLPRESSPRT